MKTRKKRIKNYLKFGVFLFGISLLLWNCEQEDYDIQNQITKYSIKESSFINFSKKKIFTLSFNKILKNKKDLFSKNGDDIYNFTIDSSSIREISKNNYTSYTFLIKRENDTSDFFENLVISINSLQNTKAYILKYTPTVETIYIENHNSFIFNGNVSILPIESDSINFLSREITTCLPVTSRLCDVAGYDPSTGVTQTGTHQASSTCEHDGTAYNSTKMVCTTETFFEAGDSGGGGTTTDNTNQTTENEEIVTSAIDDLGELGVKKECRKISTLLNDNPIFKQKLLDLSSNTNLSLGYEKSVGAFENSTNLDEHGGQVGQSSTRMLLDPTNKYVAYVHTHPQNNTTQTYSVFSFTDLKAYAKVLYNNKLNSNTFVAFLVTKKGTRYALTIHNKTKFLNAFYMYNNRYPSNVEEFVKYQESKKIIEPLFNEYFNKELTPKIKEIDSNNENVLLQFATFMKSANAGISLFEADATFSSFKRVTANSLGIKRKPCN